MCSEGHGMKYLAFIFIGMVLLSACQPAQEEKSQPEKTVLDNLPISDRDLLLAPLESAYDDLREIAEYDPNLTTSQADYDSLGFVISESVRLSGEDTVVKYQVVERPTRFEKRSWFWDDKGRMYFASARVKSMDEDGETIEVRDYKFYFEDNGALLSAYGKSAFDGAKLPSVWTPVCLTAEEESYLYGS